MQTMDPEVITTLITNFGIGGILVWFLYYTTTTSIPNLTKQHLDSQEKIASNFAESQKEITTNFADTLQKERDYRKQEIAALQQWIKSEASCRYNRDHT